VESTKVTSGPDSLGHFIINDWKDTIAQLWVQAYPVLTHVTPLRGLGQAWRVRWDRADGDRFELTPQFVPGTSSPHELLAAVVQATLIVTQVKVHIEVV
jgi:hypothetical protein